MSAGTVRIAVDIGGTFTDGIAERAPAGAIVLAKRLTTPGDPSIAVGEVVADLLAALPDGAAAAAREVVHGTTLVANAIIERKGARTALVVTAGTADVLEIGRESRYDLYDLEIELPEPLVPAARRHEVDERLNVRGEVLRAPDPADLDDLAERLEGAEAVAVCLLHAYLNPAHEAAVAAAIRRRRPDLAISLSSRVAPEVREYERMSTTAANAFVQPLAAGYLARLKDRLAARGVAAPLRIMLSGGGFTSDGAAAEVPIALLESGPAGGVISAVHAARGLGIDDLVTFDMGGTTAKACVAVAGAPALTHHFEAARVSRFKRGSGLPILAPSIDLIEIGAGGGSIAFRNALGLLNVGPESAGADPGPACYGQGGEKPTVTDADLLLGYLDAEGFLGGRMPLDRPAAEAAIDRLAGELGLSREATAWGIHDVVNENMTAAARVHIAERGLDPRRLAMVATGGAGPVHAVEVAAKLGIGRVVFTVAAGVGSCLGFLAAPARVERAWSNVELAARIDTGALGGALDRMRREIETELAATGSESAAVAWSLGVEARYTGQGATVLVTLPPGAPAEDLARRLGEAFEDTYRARFGTVVPGAPVQAVTWRLSAEAPVPARDFKLAGPTAPAGAAAGRRRIWLPLERGFAEVPVHERYALAPGTDLRGPLILAEDESTVVVARPARVEVTRNLSVSVTLEERGA